ncbi:MAG TPA: hypothetical protein VFB53_10265 [Burkholderiales bacterium]|nr:hypothetical protein [Burkholderiales bacterium]
MAPSLDPHTGHEHPLVAWTSILAILAAILLISWARIEVHGTGDLEAALTAGDADAASAWRNLSPERDRTPHEKAVDKALAAGRWAAGFSP